MIGLCGPGHGRTAKPSAGPMPEVEIYTTQDVTVEILKVEPYAG